MPKIRLSTSLTFIWKFVFPSIWLVGFGLGTFMAVWELGFEGIPILIGLVFGIALLYFVFIRAKNVYMDDEYLYVNNFRKTIRISLSEIKSVSDNVFISPRPIFIEFKNETEFGNKIMFIGYTQLFLFFSSHPAVHKIRSRTGIS